MINLSELTIKKVHDHFKNGDFTVLDLVKEYKKVIDEKNGDINAYLEVFGDIEEQAVEAQKRFTDGTATLLTGIPIAVKDNILIKGRVASAASKILENYHATYDATVIAKLKEAGAVFMGRTNMDEFAMGGSTENSAFGITRNPYDLERVSGGSSGGSAAAVAMDGALCALGTDTGGSIRQPASFCGVVGLKPTYGAVSRYGVMAMAASLNIPGPITKSVEDCEVLFNLIKGVDRLDSVTIEGKTSSEAKSIGVPRGFLKEIDKEVLENFEQSLNKLKSLGYEIKEIEIPNIEYSVATYYVVMPAEVSSDMARYDGVKYGESLEGKDLVDGYFQTRGHLFGKEVKRRIILGTYVLSAGYSEQYYNKANQVRNLITKSIKKVLDEVDVIVLPTSPTPAFKIGEKTDDPIQMYLADIFTVAANLTGLPAISVPSGTTSLNLPLGLQFMSKHLEEDKLFELGKKFEKIN